MAEQEQAEFHESNRLAVQQIRSQQAARSEEQQQAQLKSVSNTKRSGGGGSTQVNGREMCLNNRQEELHQLHNHRFRNPGSANSRPPPVALARGAAGAGKCEVIQAIANDVEFFKEGTLRTALNAINANRKVCHFPLV
jgi:hypothetical protein